MITFDNLFLSEFIKQEKDFISGARINKIQQPSRREIILNLRNNGLTRSFYININPKHYHVCFMSEKNQKLRYIEIPKKPPMFCMLLRKYLQNARISKINQPEGERILEFYFESYNEIGDRIYLCLAIELMGKYSNVILYNCDTDIILGCAHNVGSEKSSVREVYGQIPYTYPPKQINDNFINERYGFLLNFYRCNKNEVIKKLSDNREFNDVIDSYYSFLIEKEKFNELKNEYLTKIKKQLKKVEKTLNEMNYQTEKNKNCDKYRLYGDLLMANLYNLEDYKKCASVFDYENNNQIEILLDNKKTVKENANNFYKKYNKLKTSNEKLSELIQKYLSDKKYLESVLYSVEIAQNIFELKELSDEIENKKSESVKKSELNIEKIDFPQNETRIYIGKNNKQNDYIVSKLAKDEDLWFHVKDCAGSHVLLKSQKITPDLILYCAELAKKYSSAKNSTKAGVIYTSPKYLKKPPKSPLGYVTYKNEQEIVVK